MTSYLAKIRDITSRQMMVALTFLVLVAGILATTAWANSNNLLMVSAQPQKYTELYFTKPAALPRQLVSGQAYTFSFSVANHEASSQQYRYQIVVTQGDSKQTVSSGHMTVANGITAKQTATIAISSDNQPVEVSVHLVDKDQSIHFKAES